MTAEFQRTSKLANFEGWRRHGLGGKIPTRISTSPLILAVLNGDYSTPYDHAFLGTASSTPLLSSLLGTVGIRENSPRHTLLGVVIQGVSYNLGVDFGGPLSA